MSGVEVIGLILGGLPLIVSLAEHYREGFEPLVRWKRFKYIFRDFITSVDIQRQMFQLVLKKLLIRVQLEPEEKQRLLTRADYEGWRRDDVVKALRSRLGDSYQASMDLLRAMGEDLMDLQVMMSLKDGSIDWANPGEKQWKYQAKRIQLSFSENGTRTVQSLEKKIQDLKNLLDLLDSTNDTLDGMKTIPKDTTWGQLFENIRRQAESLHSAIRNGWKCRCDVTHLAGLQLQKRQASDSYPCFTMNFALPESAPPNNKLRRKVLVQRKDSKKIQGTKTPQPVPIQDNYIENLRINFDAKLSSDSSQVTLPIRPGMNSTSSSLSTFSLGSIFTKSETNTTNASSTVTTNGTEISMDSQSSSWRAMRKAKAKKKIRFLSDLPPEAGNTDFVKPSIDSFKEQKGPATPPSASEENLTTDIKIDSLCSTLKTPDLDIDYLGYLSDDEHQQHEFRLLKDTTRSSQTLEETSLEGLLANKGQMTLSRQKRYKIAGILASSLLQLQNTPWLAENLEKKNILFYRKGSDVLVEEPFINHSFTPTKAYQDEKTDVSRTLPRKTLSSLGILLLELCFGDAIENQTELRKSHLSSDGKALEGTDYLTAIEWLDKVAEEEPKMAPIIKWCIFCLFEGKPNWSDTTFTQAVYSSVVQPLEMLVVA